MILCNVSRIKDTRPSLLRVLLEEGVRTKAVFEEKGKLADLQKTVAKGRI